MKFGPVPVDQAEGSILAHSTVIGGKRLRKARRLTADDIADMKAASIGEVIVAVLSADDVDENLAAERIARALRFTGIEARPAATGRVNLHATASGIFTVDKALIDSMNRVDPDITIATMPAFAPMVEGQMVATIKIIPFAVPEAVVAEVRSLAAERDAFHIRPYRPLKVGVVQTVLPSIKQSVLDKTLKVTQDRLGRTGSSVTAEIRTPHAAPDVARAIVELAGDTDMVLVFGASAMSDPDEDVIPAAIRASGGIVHRSGMPVDPGNLFVLGEREGKPVLGAPGCARSPKENGFDWVLDRLVTGIGVTKDDIAGMGVGGLLMEIPSRPQPREPSPAKSESELPVEVVLLAAGRASRMGEGAGHKLLARFDGEPLIRRLAREALSSEAAAVHVVTGYRGEDVGDALSGLAVDCIDNPAFASGMASSLAAGIGAVSPAAGALILLGDMPGITRVALDRLIAIFRESGGRSIVRGAHEGKRGNPVILPQAAFAAARSLSGDVGARSIIEQGEFEVLDVDIGEAAHLDVDTPEAVLAAGGQLER